MDESALERYIDEFIAKELPQLEESLCLLPDELLTLCQDDTGEPRQTAERERGTVSTSVDYSSQNPTAAAELPGGSSTLEQGASAVCPMTLVMPVNHVTELPKIIPKITNVVATARLGCSLDLNFIAHNTWNVEYNPQWPSRLIMRIRKPRTTAMIYRSGKIICIGATSEQESRVATRRFARKVQKLGFPVSFLDFMIQTVSGTFRTFPVSLEQLSLAHHQNCRYEPEIFPAVFYNLRPGLTLNIFANGSMTLKGAKNETEVYEAFETVCQILSRFRRQRETHQTTAAPVCFYSNGRK
uniref:TATA-box-binding protein-like n=1 Tax=Monopterus albus TaxID=43700 RepID=UPI0009B46B32|nr:TATA-box-binding protein-like [Monopterus albus]